MFISIKQYPNMKSQPVKPVPTFVVFFMIAIIAFALSMYSFARSGSFGMPSPRAYILNMELAKEQKYKPANVGT